MKIMEIGQDENIFDVAWRDKAGLAITTNGMRKNNGCAVMGAGIAKECAQRYPTIPLMLGKLLYLNGNHAFYLGDKGDEDKPQHLFSFPTKHNWRDWSDIMLIRRSCLEITKLMDTMSYMLDKCYLLKPGCSNGHLDWESTVKPAISELLDDRFTVVYRA